MARGRELIREGLQAGFSSQEMLEWEAGIRAEGLSAGFTMAEMDEYFGTVKPDPTPIQQHIREGFAIEEFDNPDFWEAFRIGFGQSITGLIRNLNSGNETLEVLGENPSVADSVVSQLGTLVGDSPAMVAGAIAGGGPIGGFAGAFALPAAMRHVLMNQYQSGEIQSFEQFWDVFSGALIETAKGYMVGAATGGVAGVLKTPWPYVGKAPGAVRVGAEVATMVSVGSALEGHVPQPREFAEAAMVIAAAKGAVTGVAKAPAAVRSARAKLEGIYARTGRRPAEVAQDAMSDLSILEDVASVNKETPRAYAGTEVSERRARPTEAETKDAAHREASSRARPPQDAKAPRNRNAILEELDKAEEALTEAEATGQGIGPAKILVRRLEAELRDEPAARIKWETAQNSGIEAMPFSADGPFPTEGRARGRIRQTQKQLPEAEGEVVPTADGGFLVVWKKGVAGEDTPVWTRAEAKQHGFAELWDAVHRGASEAELAGLLRTGAAPAAEAAPAQRAAVPEVPKPGKAVSKMTKAELAEYAGKLGDPVGGKATKADLVKLIREREAAAKKARDQALVDQESAAFAAEQRGGARKPAEAEPEVPRGTLTAEQRSELMGAFEETGGVTTTVVQRTLKVGRKRAEEILNELEADGTVKGVDPGGSAPRVRTLAARAEAEPELVVVERVRTKRIDKGTGERLPYQTRKGAENEATRRRNRDPEATWEVAELENGKFEVVRKAPKDSIPAPDAEATVQIPGFAVLRPQGAGAARVYASQRSATEAMETRRLAEFPGETLEVRPEGKGFVIHARNGRTGEFTRAEAEAAAKRGDRAAIEALEASTQEQASAAPPPEPPAGGGVSVGEAPPPPPGSPTNAVESVLSHMSINEPGVKRRWSYNDFIRDWFDKKNPLNRAVRAMAESVGETLSIVHDAYKLARLQVGSSAKGTHWLQYSPFEYGTLRKVGRPLKEILDPVKDRLDDFRAYLASKRALELEERGIKHGFNLEHTREVVRLFERDFEPIRTELTEFQNHVLNYLRESGVISREMQEMMVEMNKNYVPFHRIFEDGTGGAAKTGKSGNLQAKNPIQAIIGNEAKVLDPIESIIKNTYTFIELAERAEVGRQFVDLAARSGEVGAQYAKKAKRKFQPINLSPKEQAQVLKKLLEGTGREINAEAVAEFEANIESVMTIFRAKGLRPARNQILVLRDGKRELWDIDPEIYRVFEGADSASASAIVKILEGPAKWLRAGAVLSPDFMGRNIIRDSVSQFLFSEAGSKPILEQAAGIFHLAGKGELYQLWLRSGGPMAELVALDRQYLQKDIRALIGHMEWHETTRNVLTSPIQVLRALSSASEQATRIGEFGKVLGAKRFEKMTPEEAAALSREQIMEAGFASREITLDFAMAGLRGAVLNRHAAFFNAHMQGLSKTARAFRDRPKETAIRIAAGVTFPSVALAVMHHFNSESDPEYAKEYRNIPQWQKDLFWLVPVDFSAEKPGRTWFRIPKPFEVGIIFGSGAERITNWLLNEDPRAFDGFLKTAGRGLTPGYIPTAAVPVIETWANKSLFTGRPIIPADREKMTPEYEYTPYTTELTKAVARNFAKIPGMDRSYLASPAVLENAYRAWTGGVGMYLLNLADAGLRGAGKLPEVHRPEAGLEDLPVIKAFVVRFPTAGSENVTRFYEAYAEDKEMADTIRGLARAGEVDAMLMEMQASGGGVATPTGIRQTLGEMNRLVRSIYRNPNIPPREKRQNIDAIYLQMIDFAELGLEIIENMRKIRETVRENFRGATR